MENTKITVEVTVNASVEKVWQYWTEPKHIKQWYYASDEWHTPHAENDLRLDGKFLSRMEAKDGSFGFDFEGIYTEIKPFENIKYVIVDGREVEIIFIRNGDTIKISEIFDPENENPIELQKGGLPLLFSYLKA